MNPPRGRMTQSSAQRIQQGGMNERAVACADASEPPTRLLITDRRTQIHWLWVQLRAHAGGGWVAPVGLRPA